MALITRGNTPMPFEYVRWRLAKEFGWTLEQVDALSMADLHEYYQVTDGMNKAQGSFFTRPPAPPKVHKR